MDNIEITFKRKSVKNISIKIKSQKEVILTYPIFISKKRALEFLESKKTWIEKKLSTFPKELDLVDGDVVKYLGFKYRLKLITSKKNRAFIEDKIIMIESKNIDDFELKQKILKEFYRQKAKEIFPKLLVSWEKITNQKVQKLTIRDSKTRWGSCNTQKAYINLSLHLVKKPLDAIEYVILHELAHLTHPNHSREFYSYIEKFMPDFRERGKMLKTLSL